MGSEIAARNRKSLATFHRTLKSQCNIALSCLGNRAIWRVPNPPGANPLVAERAPWRSSQSCVTGAEQPIGRLPTDSCHFFCTPGNPCATPIVTRGEGSFRYQGVSTRRVRHSPGDFLGPRWASQSQIAKIAAISVH